MVIAISTGSCFDLKLSFQDRIRFIQKFSVDGIELLFASPKDLLEFEFDKDTFEFVNSLKFKSIHMPFNDIEYKDDELTKKVIDKATKLSIQIKIDYLVFHPNNVKDYSVLNYDLKNCIENLNSNEKNKGYCTVQEIKQIFDRNPKLYFILDTCHVFQNNIELNDFLIFKEKLLGIHLATQWKQGERIRTHGFLQENLEQLEKIKPLLKLNVIKIIESDFYPEKVPMIKKEIELIKN
ncbi:MAG: hypothetical protein PHQ98_03350 [Candidatus ainarchaeum sp.]|nr:hypothetical protein [Candidatus ainarchaeum sp.]